MLKRFLRYVALDTQSDDSAPETQSPTTSGQLVLARQLVEELRELGLADAHVDEHGYVYATLPENLPSDHPAKGRVPVIGLNAHLDTASEASGCDVRPQIYANYQGQDLTYPDDPELVLRVADNPELKGCLGSTIITAGGRTLLGADDKAGVAEIMAIVEYLLQVDAPHGEIRILFSPDEEQGRGMSFINLAKFPVQCAYTLDGGRDGYRNMRTVIDRHPEVMELLEAACRLQGVAVIHHPIRGGTDGATLSIDHGIPTPNIWAGGMNLHGRLEWTSVDWMASAAETTLTLLGLWVERSS
jgi:di/tripeptidase